MKKRILALLLSVALLLTTGIGTTAFATEGADSLPGANCTHVHDEFCGYIEGADCSHVCEEDCAEGCTHTEHDEACGYAEAADCGHEHDGDCGGLSLGDSGGLLLSDDGEICVCTAYCDDPDCPVCKDDHTQCFFYYCVCESLCGEDSANAACPVCADDYTSCVQAVNPPEIAAMAAGNVANESDLRATVASSGSGDVVLSNDITITYTDSSGYSGGSNALIIDKNPTTIDLNGYDLTITANGDSANGIKIANGVTLTIMDSSSPSTGKLTVTNSATPCDFGYGAGINVTEGTLIIQSGTIEAKGGYRSAGIGGGDGGDGGTITINGGDITATGGYHGAGIGGSVMGAGGDITISGSAKVTANGGFRGAGIGGGYYGDGGTIAISGGTVEATGGDYGAGIGGGGDGGSGGSITINGDADVTATSGDDGAGIGGGDRGDGGTITIGGSAIVTAYSSDFGCGAGIGGGSEGAGGTIKIEDNAQVTANGGSAWSDESYAIGGGAGIGSGGGFSLSNSGDSGASGNITITDNASVTATGGAGDSSGFFTGHAGAGIGSGGAGGSGSAGSTGTITINTTGTVTVSGGAADGGANAGANIGKGGSAGGTGASTIPTINATAGTGGSISPGGQTRITLNGSQAFTITPNSGYAIAQVLVNGTNDTTAVSSGSYNFTSVTADHTIEAVFGAIEINANPTSLAFGNVPMNTNLDKTLTIAGAHLTGNIIYGVTGTDAAAFTVSPASPLGSAGGTLTVTFSPTELRAYSASLLLQSTGAPDVTVAFTGTGVNLPQAAPTGLGKTDETAAGNDGTITNVTTEMQYKLQGATGYTPVPGTTITGLAPGTYLVRYAAKTGYDASPDAIVTIAAHVAPPSPPANISVTGVSLNRSALALVVNDTYTLSATVAPSNATNKAVIWSSDNPSVATVVNGVVAAISPGTATITVTTVDGGYAATCTVTVSKLVYGFIGGGFLVVTDNTVSVQGTIGTDFSNFGNGTVWVDSKQLSLPSQAEVTSGSVIVTLKPAFLQTLSSGSYPVEVRFANGGIASTTLVIDAKGEPQHTIAASAGAHGSISPSGDVKVSDGSDFTFYITPDSGYRIDKLSVDGKTAKAVNNTYTFANVQGNHTIHVTFKITEDGGSDDPDIPKTGDASDMMGWWIVLGASVLGTLCILVWRKWRQLNGTW